MKWEDQTAKLADNPSSSL